MTGGDERCSHWEDWNVGHHPSEGAEDSGCSVGLEVGRVSSQQRGRVPRVEQSAHRAAWGGSPCVNSSSRRSLWPQVSQPRAGCLGSVFLPQFPSTEGTVHTSGGFYED